MTESAGSYFFKQAVGAGREKMAVFSASRFETQRIKRVLSVLGLTNHRRKLIQLSEGDGSEPGQITAAAFNTLFSNFPFQLAVSNLRGLRLDRRITADNYAIHTDPASTEPARFKQFDKVPFMQHYLSLLTASPPRARPLALLVPRKGMPMGLVVHNDDSDRYWTHGLSMVYKYTPMRIYVQSWRDVISAIQSEFAGSGFRVEEWL